MHLKFSVFLFLFWNPCLYVLAQNHTGQFHGPFEEPLLGSTTRNDLYRSYWHITLQSLYEKNKSSLFKTTDLKNAKRTDKLHSPQGGFTQSKTTGSNPQVGTNFKGNELKTWTPTDNTIAVSNGGKIISCINYSIEYYDTAGNNFLLQHTWDAFVNNTNLSDGKFDPRVVYDPKHDRFIVVLLHGFSSWKSKILVAFSKTNDPLDGWNLYQLPGNPFQDSTWTDYPTIGINDQELFINGNRFGDAPNYKWKETYIYQIQLNKGYAGQSLQYGIWNNIFTPDSVDGITLYPASDGMGLSLNEKMYFVQLRPDSGSKVYVFRIDGQLVSPNKSMTSYAYAIPHYEVCANAFQKDPSTGYIDSLSTGNAWVQNAFYLNGVIHYTQSADIGQGWCGLNYGRILLDSGYAVTTQHGEVGTDLCYPALASMAYTPNERGVVLAYLRSDSSMTPECGVISVDHDMVWSSKQVVKTGDTSVNILYPPAYPIMPERWGDYTGICRKYNAAVPEAWLAAAYGTNTLPRRASWGTWIAQVTTTDPQVPLNTTSHELGTGLQLYPNPAIDLFALEFENKIAGPARIELYDVQGKLIKILFDDALKVSMNRLSFNRNILQPGTYFVRLKLYQQAVQSTILQIQ
ncbi:MAG: T9SS type A sorting domain-containing protein [Chitinophagaceae bacterium]|nr:T9SS type A sorting domain-containing protein [Chitinophagaceae bacterium]